MFTRKIPRYKIESYTQNVKKIQKMLTFEDINFLVTVDNQLFFTKLFVHNSIKKF